ncbi:MAG: CsgG/HfaB family protein [Spirochaetota bacterium]
MNAVLLSVVFASVLLPAGKTHVAVLDFAGRSGVSGIDAAAVSDFFRTDLVKTKSCIVVDRGNMQTLLKEQELQTTGCTETECAVRIGKILSVQYVCSGTLVKFGDKFVVSISLVNVENGQIEGSEREIVDNFNAIIGTSERLASKFGAQFNTLAERTPDAPKVSSLSTVAANETRKAAGETKPSIANEATKNAARSPSSTPEKKAVAAPGAPAVALKADTSSNSSAIPALILWESGILCDTFGALFSGMAVSRWALGALELSYYGTRTVNYSVYMNTGFWYSIGGVIGYGLGAVQQSAAHAVLQGPEMSFLGRISYTAGLMGITAASLLAWPSADIAMDNAVYTNSAQSWNSWVIASYITAGGGFLLAAIAPFLPGDRSRLGGSAVNDILLSAGVSLVDIGGVLLIRSSVSRKNAAENTILPSGAAPADLMNEAQGLRIAAISCTALGFIAVITGIYGDFGRTPSQTSLRFFPIQDGIGFAYSW